MNDIEQAYKLLEPLAGGIAALLFGVALLASGQSSTLTGTIAGQVILDGFLRIRLPVYQRRLITRSLALLPALVGVLLLGDGGIGRLLVWTQVVLSMQLPLAMWPLIRLSNDPKRMGAYANGRLIKTAAWGLFALISAANLTLLLVLCQQETASRKCLCHLEVLLKSRKGFRRGRLQVGIRPTRRFLLEQCDRGLVVADHLRLEGLIETVARPSLQFLQGLLMRWVRCRRKLDLLG